MKTTEIVKVHTDILDAGESYDFKLERGWFIDTVSSHMINLGVDGDYGSSAERIVVISNLDVKEQYFSMRIRKVIEK